MITQFCNLCNKFMNTTVNITQRYASKSRKQYVSNRKKNIQRNLEKLKLKEKLKENEDRTLIISTKRKEYNFYEGDTFNKFKTVLVTLGWHKPEAKMDYFTIHATKNNFVHESTESFKDLGFSSNFVEVLENSDIKFPTQIQKESFSKLMEGMNTIIAAETGSGKTLAYLLPLLEQVKCNKSLENRNLNSPLGLIVTPSRELAAQIQREVKKLIKGTDIVSKLIIGGRTKRVIRNPSINQIDILIATFGALSKFVTNRVYKLDYLQHVVLDEADSLFHITFQDKLVHFLKKIQFKSGDNPEEDGVQLTLASATMPTNVSSVLHSVVNTSSLVTAATQNLHTINIPQKFIRVGISQKPMVLIKLIKNRVMQKQSFIIFTNKSKTCDWLSDFLKQFNIDNISLHGNMPVNARKDRYLKFNNRQVCVLCTTDAGSRGLDTTHVQEVINYDFPLQTAEYIHRCGRTGRVGSPKNCQVTSFICRHNEIVLARKIEIAARKGLEIPIVDMLDAENPKEHESLIQQIQHSEKAQVKEQGKTDQFGKPQENETYIPY